MNGLPYAAVTLQLKQGIFYAIKDIPRRNEQHMTDMRERQEMSSKLQQIPTQCPEQDRVAFNDQS